MGRDAKFRGTFGLSPQPVAGVALYTGRESRDLSIDEMLVELEKSEIRDTRKEELLARVRERIANLGAGEGAKPTSKNPKRYLVDPDTGRIDVDEENGDFTYKDALLTSSSIKGKSGQFEGAVALINAAKALTEGTSKSTSEEEKKKEFYVDDDGIIHHDPENGELTLSEARAVSQSKQKPQTPATSGFYIDSKGVRHDLAPGQPIVVERETPGVNYVVDPRTGELQEYKPGQPIVVKIESKERSSSTPFQLTDKAGNPMVLDIESLISFKKFEGEERRADEAHQSREEMGGVFKDFLGKIASATQRMASR